MAEHELITPEEIIKIVHNDALTIEHLHLAWKTKKAWIKVRRTEDDRLKDEEFEAMMMFGVVFYAGIVYGKRELRARKKKKALRR